MFTARQQGSMLKPHQRLKRLFKIVHRKGYIRIGKGWVGLVCSLIVQVQLGLGGRGKNRFGDLQTAVSS